MSEVRSLAGRSAVVTGASRGIGAEIARRLAGAGAKVALLARTRSALERVASGCGPDAIVIETDFADATTVDAAVDGALAAFGGPPDILVNNAGIFDIVSLREMTVDAFSEMTRTNMVAPFAFIRAFLGPMLERGAGHIVTIGSISDRSIFSGNGGYAASKFGMRAMHEVLREETRGSGVRATLVSPAGVDTDLWTGIRFAGNPPTEPDRSQMLQAASVADAVLFALSRPADVNVDELRLSRA